MTGATGALSFFSDFSAVRFNSAIISGSTLFEEDLGETTLPVGEAHETEAGRLEPFAAASAALCCCVCCCCWAASFV